MPDVPVTCGEEPGVHLYPSVTLGPVNTSLAERELSWNPTPLTETVKELVIFYESASRNPEFRREQEGMLNSAHIARNQQDMSKAFNKASQDAPPSYEEARQEGQGIKGLDAQPPMYTDPESQRAPPIGSLYFNDCPAEWRIPLYLIVGGSVGNVIIYRTYGHFSPDKTVSPYNYCDQTLFDYAFWLTTSFYILLGTSCCCICFCGCLASLLGGDKAT
uniref:Uncharacterized protein n=1 Tax=Magallana gigas TaxID=29159 RepID=K1QJ38_MAGGI